MTIAVHNAPPAEQPATPAATAPPLDWQTLVNLSNDCLTSARDMQRECEQVEELKRLQRTRQEGQGANA